MTGGAQESPRLGRWLWAVVLLGWIAGVAGWATLRRRDPRRAHHVLYWGLVSSAGWLAFYILLAVLGIYNVGA